MRLNFRILWVDDQQKHVNSFAEGLQYRLIDLGFELEVIRKENLEGTNDFIDGHVHGDGIDLVLVDYDLGTGNGDGGAEALLAIRKKFPYKEIIFYSALDTKKLRRIAYDAEVDGIIFSTRLSLVSDTIQVIDNLLRRIMDVDHMRGVVMSATSDIDYLVEHSLKKIYENLEKDDAGKFCADLAVVLEQKLSKWQTDLKKAAAKSSFDAVLKLRHIFSAMDRVESLKEHLTPMGSSTTIYQEKIGIYCDKVVPRRNKLAHVILKKNDDGAELTGMDGFTLDDLALLRRELIEHRKNFHTVAVLLDVTI